MPAYVCQHIICVSTYVPVYYTCWHICVSVCVLAYLCQHLCASTLSVQYYLCQHLCASICVPANYLCQYVCVSTLSGPARMCQYIIDYSSAVQAYLFISKHLLVEIQAYLFPSPLSHDELTVPIHSTSYRCYPVVMMHKDTSSFIPPSGLCMYF